jgi:hypothetical protein
MEGATSRGGTNPRPTRRERRRPADRRDLSAKVQAPSDGIRAALGPTNTLVSRSQQAQLREASSLGRPRDSARGRPRPRGAPGRCDQRALGARAALPQIAGNACATWRMARDARPVRGPRAPH